VAVAFQFPADVFLKCINYTQWLKNMALNFCLYFRPDIGKKKNFANQSDSWPWQTICNKTALKFSSCLKIPNTLRKAGSKCGEKIKLSFINMLIFYRAKLLTIIRPKLCDYSLISQLQYMPFCASIFTAYIQNWKDAAVKIHGKLVDCGYLLWIFTADIIFAFVVTLSYNFF